MLELSLMSLYSLTSLVLIISFVIYTATKIVYNIYFHPLSKFPGPKFAAATQIPVSYASWNGVNSQWLASLHEEYSSDVVRVAPDELSFISPSAWKDIYSHRPGHATFPKDVSQLVTIDNILTANDPDHSRIRRLFNQAFSEKAVREQEPLIKSHVNTLVDQLKKQDEGPARGKVDLAKWYVWTTFDVIGDLAFGESFDCLKENNFHPWVASLTVLLRTVVFASIASRFPLVGRILRLFVTKDMVQKREDHQRWSAEKVNRRIETGSSRPDLLSYVLPHADTKRGMTPEELHVNIRTFIVAGSDSTANMLNAATWFLVRHPSCLERATNEVREAFRSVHDITSRSVGKLEYLQAVIDESFRLHTATTAGQPRKAPGQGDTVSGYWVPGGTVVQLNQYAAFTSRLNFTSPKSFIPERWLPNPDPNSPFSQDKKEVLQPFSIGPRSCIGKNLAIAEMHLVLAHMLWEFDMRLHEDTDLDWANQKGWFTWNPKPLIVELKVRSGMEL